LKRPRWNGARFAPSLAVICSNKILQILPPADQRFLRDRVRLRGLDELEKGTIRERRLSLP
jgi:hypothetical protein